MTENEIANKIVGLALKQITTMVTMVYTKYTMNFFIVTIVLTLCSLWLNKYLASLDFLFSSFFYHHTKIICNLKKLYFCKNYLKTKDLIK